MTVFPKRLLALSTSKAFKIFHRTTSDSNGSEKVQTEVLNKLSSKNKKCNLAYGHHDNNSVPIQTGRRYSIIKDPGTCGVRDLRSREVQNIT
jgi:hypothetical protein